MNNDRMDPEQGWLAFALKHMLAAHVMDGAVRT